MRLKREKRAKGSMAAGLAVLILLAGCSSEAGGERHGISADTGSHSRAPAAVSGDAASQAMASSAGEGAMDNGPSKKSKGSKDISIAQSEMGESLPAENKKSNPEPQPGMLTAGEWNDHAAWSKWKDLSSGGEGSGYIRLWGFDTRYRMVVSVTRDGSPAVDVPVRLQCGQDDGWSARTDNTGRAYLFAALASSRDLIGREGFGDEPAAPQGTGELEDNGQSNGGFSPEASSCRVKASPDGGSPASRTLEQSDWKAGTAAISLDGSGTQPSEVLDLMLMVDATGSMADELKYLSEELSNVVRQVKKKNGQTLEIRVSPNFYRDRHDEYVVRPFPFTTDVVEAQGRIAAQEADGGQDYPEAVDEALENAVSGHDWSKSARARLLLLVLDAPPHREQAAAERIRLMAAEAAKQGIRIIPVAASGADLETEMLMRTLAVATGGSYVFLTDDSGIGDSHKKPEGATPQIMPLNDLLADLIGRYVSASIG
ncbi:vWA domain-containing protein [Paenibacillus sp. D9]|uniref:vWA domain-containing protein n=1 Tax=Paenibacillus sp. D9 TaxID=665792 RepID=UPI0006767991|nr:vWA domain-containing protein [Paenibacillus sp. D9]